MTLLVCLTFFQPASMTNPQHWQESNHVHITSRTLEANTIFFQEAGHTIDTIGTLHAHFQLDIQRPLQQLRRIHDTVRNGIAATHNQLLTFVQVARNYKKYNELTDHPLSNRIMDQNTLTELLAKRDYIALLQDIPLLHRFTTTTYQFATAVPNSPVQLDADLQQAYITPTSDPFQHTRSRLTRTFPTLINELQQWLDLDRDIEVHRQHLSPFDGLQSRQRRFIPLLVTGLAVLASTFLGTWNTVEIQQLKTSNHELVVKMDDIVKQQLANDVHLDLIDRAILTVHQDLQQLHLDHIHQRFIEHTARQLQVVQQEITQITQVLDGLIQHRLSSSILDQDIINNMFLNLSRTADNLQYNLLPTNTFELIQCPTSFLAQNHTVHIFLHVPITRPDATKLTIYKYIPLPFHVNHAPSFITRPTKQYIAINSLKQTFFTMDRHEFEQCQSVGKLFICHNQIIHNHSSTQLDTNSTIPKQEACLFALFLQRAETAMKVCDIFPIQLDPPQLHQLHADQVLIHTYSPTIAITTCPNGDHADLHISQPTMVTIPPTCTISVPHSAFTASINLDRTFHHKIYTWPHDPIKFLNPLQSTIPIQSLQSRLPSLHPATNIKVWAQDGQHYTYLYIWNFVNSIIIVLLTIFMLCYLLRLPLMVARNMQAPAFPTPSAPPPSPQFRQRK